MKDRSSQLGISWMTDTFAWGMQRPAISDQLLHLFLDISGWVTAELVEISHMICSLSSSEFN
jgi:hypothetical protein